MGGRTDGELLRAAGADEAAFVEFVERHQTRLARYVTRRLGRAPAEDIVNETFAIAYAKRDVFRVGQETAEPWLLGIATNLMRRHARAEAKALRAFAATGVDPYAPDMIESAGGIDPALAGALAALRPRYRDVLFLHAVCDLSHEQIAEALDVPVGTARAWLHRARVSAEKELAARGVVNRSLPDTDPQGAET